MAIFYTDSASFNNLSVTGSTVLNAPGSTVLQLIGSGSTILSISGSAGEIFNISDAGASNNLFSVATGSTTILSIDNTKKVNISGSLVVTGSLTGSLQGTASWASNYNETDPVFTAKSASLATTSSNTFFGLQTISSSTDLSALDIHVKDDILWTFRTYNDTYSSTSIGLASWIDNDGVSFLGTETDRPLHIYNNANYYNPTLLISSSGVTVNNQLIVDNGITGSLFGTASWAISASRALSASWAPIPTPIINVSGSSLYSTDPGTSNFSPTNGIFLGSLAGATATNANNSIFLGQGTGDTAINANNSVFIGTSAGYAQSAAAYSIFIGHKAGAFDNISAIPVSDNNIIIGTDLSLPTNYKDSITIGGIIFATGSNRLGGGGLWPNYSPITTGKVGIGTYNPTHNFQVSGTVAFPNLTTTNQANVVTIDTASGQLFYTASSAFGGGGGGTPGGSDTQVQFNSGSTFSGNTYFTYNYVNQSLQQGDGTIASGPYSHAEGFSTQAIGSYSHAEGGVTQAIGDNSHAEGSGTKTGVTNAYYAESVVNGVITLSGSYSDVSTNFSGSNRLYLYDIPFDNAYGRAVFVISQSYFSSPNTIIELQDTSVNTTTAYIGNINQFIGNWTGDQTIPGNDAHAEGFQTYAVGRRSHTEGGDTVAIGTYSHAEGYNGIASGDFSHAEGNTTYAYGLSSHTEGADTIAIGARSHAEGQFTQAVGQQSHAEGSDTIAIGNSSHAEGNTTISSGSFSHAEGQNTQAIGDGSHAEGYYTTAVGQASHTEGYLTAAGSKAYQSAAPDFGTATLYLGTKYGDLSGALSGYSTILFYSASIWTKLTVGFVSTGYGGDTLFYLNEAFDAGESGSVVIVGYPNPPLADITINSTYAHAEGYNNSAIGNSSHAEGQSNLAVGDYSHAEGSATITIGNYSHTEGAGTIASGSYSHAEGESTIATGQSSHAEGSSNQAIGTYSHAEGASNQAIGVASHAEGAGTQAIGAYSHAEGVGTQAIGEGSHAEGAYTAASGSYQHVQGQFNISSSAQSAFIIGNGTDNNNRSNLVFASGSSFQITGSLRVSGSITGSLFGTASWAQNVITASAILGGAINHVPYFITDTTLATSSIYQSGSDSVIINADVNTTANPEALFVEQVHPTSFNVISGKGNLNNYLQLNIQNRNAGTSVSSDVVATANNGDENGNYVDMGINGSNYNGIVGGPNDAYLYTTGSHLHIGNATPNMPVQFFVGGFDTNADRKFELNPNNQHNMTGSLDVSGSVKAFSFTGSLLGTASSAITSQTSSYSTTLGASLSQPANNQVRLLNSAGGTLSTVTVNNVTSASYANNASTADYATIAGNGGVTQIIAGSGITLIPTSGQGAVTVAATGVGGVTIISGSLVTGSFINTTSYTFNHNLNTRTPIITVFDSNYNQIIPESITLVNTSSATITFPTAESGFAIGSTGGTTGTALSSSYSLTSTYADTASYYIETDPIFVARSASLATTGSNVFRGNQTITGSVFVTGSSTLIGNQTITGSLTVSGSSTFTNIGPAIFSGSVGISGSTTQAGNNTLIGNTVLSGSINISGSQTFRGTHVLSGSFEVSGSSNFHNSEFIVTGSTSILGNFNVKGTSTFSDTTFTITGSQLFSGSSNINGNQTITGSLNVIGNINVVSGSSFTRWGNKLFNYAQLANTASIPVTQNVSASIQFPLTYFSDGISVVSGSRITFTNTGLYNIQYSALAQQGNTTPSLRIWFRKTGSNVDNSSTIIQLQNNSQTAVTSQFAQSISASEYIEIWYHSNGANTSFPYTTAGSGFPAAPSIIVTVTQIA